jgi:hypothetical protein
VHGRSPDPEACGSGAREARGWPVEGGVLAAGQGRRAGSGPREVDNEVAERSGGPVRLGSTADEEPRRRRRAAGERRRQAGGPSRRGEAPVGKRKFWQRNIIIRVK